jgi:hypothetical protein
MKTPERLSALRNARLTLRKRDRRIAYIKRQLESLTLERGVTVESDVQLEIQGVIERESLQMESVGNSDFRRIFWEQQVHILRTGTYFIFCFIGSGLESQRAQGNALASAVFAVVSQPFPSISKGV